jgi:glycine amidinotransferase
VRRPEPIPQRRPYRTLDWASTGRYAAMPRDALLVVGGEIIECPMAWRSRYHESLAYRPLLKRYFRAGARWSAAPRPELTDEQFDQDWPSRARASPPGDWLRRHLGDGYRVHAFEFSDAHPMHIDATSMPVAPGKLLVNPERSGCRRCPACSRTGRCGRRRRPSSRTATRCT